MTRWKYRRRQTAVINGHQHVQILIGLFQNLQPDISLKPFRSRKRAHVLMPTAIPHMAWPTTAGAQDRALSTIVWIVSCQPERANEKLLSVMPQIAAFKKFQIFVFIERSHEDPTETRNQDHTATAIPLKVPICVWVRQAWLQTPLSRARRGKEYSRPDGYLLRTRRPGSSILALQAPLQLALTDHQALQRKSRTLRLARAVCVANRS